MFNPFYSSRGIGRHLRKGSYYNSQYNEPKCPYGPYYNGDPWEKISKIEIKTAGDFFNTLFAIIIMGLVFAFICIVASS